MIFPPWAMLKRSPSNLSVGLPAIFCLLTDKSENKKYVDKSGCVSVASPHDSTRTFCNEREKRYAETHLKQSLKEKMYVQIDFN